MITLSGKFNYTFDPSDGSSQVKRGGKHSDVYLGKDENNQHVIIKKIQPGSESLITTQIESNLQTKHPNIISCIETIEQNHHRYIVFPYVDSVNLKMLIKHRLNRKIRLIFTLQVLSRILDALETVHKAGIIHRDIKPENILIRKDKNGKINWHDPNPVLIDFGLAQKTGSPVQEKRLPFSLVYSPPEQVLNFPALVNESSDLYALAITMYEFLAGKKAFYANNPEILMNLMITQKLKKTGKIPGSVFSILAKASHKSLIGKPPVYYKKPELKTMIRSGQEKRYQKAGDFHTDVEKIRANINEKPGFMSIFSDFKKKHV